jgi:hypothetical protein
VTYVASVVVFAVAHVVRGRTGHASATRHNTVIGVFPLPQWTDALQLVAPATTPTEIPPDTTAQLIAHLRATNTTLGCLFIAGDRAGVGKTR